MRKVKILLVEDDKDVREMAAEMLTFHGHEVTAAADGAEAELIFGRRHDFDLLFTDIALPGELDGFDLARRLKRTAPDLRVLYATAYADLAGSEPGMVYGKVIQKPYRSDQLQQEICRTIGLVRARTPAYWREKAASFRALAAVQTSAEAVRFMARAEEFEAMAERIETDQAPAAPPRPEAPRKEAAAGPRPASAKAAIATG